MGRTDLADGDAPFMETGQRVVDLEFEVHDFCHLHVNVLTEQNIAPP